MWSSPQMAAAAELIRSTTGLVFPAVRAADVEAVIERAMSRRGVRDGAAMLALLRDDDRLREDVVAELTIGETYFQRDPLQLQMLKERILPGLLASRPADLSIRVWSAGCASGEEPYSVAMLFDQLGAAPRAQIVATDISRERLATAQRGSYAKWSLRSIDDELRERYFIRRGPYHDLSPSLRQMVDFRYLNLAEDHYPSLSTGIWGMDVILCRNVLIYFDRDTVARVARGLIDSLSEEGWLLVGASDPAISDYVECDVVVTNAGLAYRRRGVDRSAGVIVPAPPRYEPAQPEEEAPDTAPDLSYADVPGDEPAITADATPPAGVPVDSPILVAYARRDFAAVGAVAAREAAGRRLSEPEWAAWLRALANQGRLQDATAVTSRALAESGARPELLYLNAVLLLETGRAADALEIARQALYMDRGMEMAHITLADALRRTGDVAGARRSLRNAVSLLAARPADDEVPAADGETAGQLLELVRVKLALLAESP
ncbi:MAG TPA: protein-glutamate O-methyltransferase CheR [Longimicrobiales bacterium]|nr:protein-glutamate O-methyltransferase CheR [Longimicrobiales bacterium]